MNANSMMSGIGASGGQQASYAALNQANSQLYSGANEIEGDLVSQLNKMQCKQTQGAANGPANEFDNGGEDLIMMNIPREGNADQLNKSTKLTLSSKKQYENHM